VGGRVRFSRADLLHTLLLTLPAARAAARPVAPLQLLESRTEMDALAAYASSDDDDDDDNDDDSSEHLVAAQPSISSTAADGSPAEALADSQVAASKEESAADEFVTAAAPLRLPSPPLDAEDCDERPESSATACSSDGRIRQIGHLDGHFAVHVFLPVAPGAGLRQSLQQSVAAVEAHGRANGATVHAIEPAEYHVSLSRTVMLPLAQIDAFADALRRALRPCAAVRTAVGALCELPNDTHTRYFASVELRSGSAGHDALCTLVDAVDAVLVRYDQPRFYSERRMHFSVAWSLRPLLGGIDAAWQLHTSNWANCRLDFDRVTWRIGERTTTCRLRDKSRTEM